MGTTSEKLTYLNGTKQALKESINNIGGEITSETTFREYAEELDNIYDNLPKTTGEDTNLSLTTLKGKMNIIPKGDTSQDTYEGYNILQIKAQTITQNGITYTIYEDGSIKVNGTASGNSYCVLTNSNNSLSGYTTALFTMQSSFYQNPKKDTTSVQMLYRGTNANYYNMDNVAGHEIGLVYLQVNNGVTINNLTIYPIIVNGSSTEKAWEPYVGGTASPNPSFPQNIEVVTGTQEVKVENVNLANWENGGINTQGQENDQTYSVRTKNYINTTTQKTFTFSKKMAMTNSNINMMARCYDSSKTFIGSQTALSYSATSNTYTFADNVKYIRLVQFGSETENVQTTDYELMCEVGSTATTYTPHQEQTQIVELSSKNLFGDILRQGVTNYETGTYNPDNIIRITTTNWIALPKGTYTISAKTNQNITLAISNVTFDTNGNFYNISGVSGQWKDLPYTITLPQDTKWKCNLSYTNGQEIFPSEISEMQIEVGSQKTSYEEYYNYELAKIGNYQDYLYKSNDKWYKKEYILSKIMTSTDINTRGTTGTNAYYIATKITGLDDNSKELAYCNMFKPCSFNNRVNGLDVVYLQNGYLNIRTANNTSIDWSTLAIAKEWVDTNKPLVYYVLATPNDIEITDEILIEQLDNLEKLMSYNGTTNISSSGNLSAILGVSALKGE